MSRMFNDLLFIWPCNQRTLACQRFNKGHRTPEKIAWICWLLSSDTWNPPQLISGQDTGMWNSPWNTAECDTVLHCSCPVAHPQQSAAEPRAQRYEKFVSYWSRVKMWRALRCDSPFSILFLTSTKFTFGPSQVCHSSGLISVGIQS